MHSVVLFLFVCLLYTVAEMATFSTSGEIRLSVTSSRVTDSFVKHNSVVTALDISNTFLRDAEKYKRQYPLQSYVHIVNTKLKVIRLEHSDRLEDRLKRVCWRAFDTYKKLKGKKQRDFASKLINVSILENEVKDLRSLEDASTSSPHTPHHTKSIDEMGSRQRHRALTGVKEHVLKALRFIETLGLNVRALDLVSDSGKDFHMPLSETEGAENTELVKSLSFVLDKFGVSDAAYHELSQLISSLPRKSALVDNRREQTAEFEIQRLTGEIPGAIISFRGELIRKATAYIKENPYKSKITIKLGGDGTKVSRISNFVVFSFHIVDENVKLSSLEQCTLAILSCKEDYHSLKSSLKGLFQEVNDIVREQFIEVLGQRVAVDILFGSDMKMIQTILGLGGSTGNYACPWCIVHKKDRHIIMEDMLHYHGAPARSIPDMTSQADKLQFGVQHVPLLSISIANYVIDELHLLMRVTDVLERNLIKEAMERDAKLKRDKAKSHHLEDLVRCFRDCGVTFSVWEDRDSKLPKWTSLSGLEKKKVLKKLPTLLTGKLSPDTEADVIKLWRDFYSLHEKITSRCDVTGQQLFEEAKSWLSLFLSLGDKRKWYQNQNVTPYMHCLVYHVPAMVDKHGPLRYLSGQALEKLNDDVKLIHQKKCQKWDSTKEALQVRKRVEANADCARKKRPYVKRKLDYWDVSITESRRKKRTPSSPEQNTDTDTDTVEKLTISELRDLLNQKGVGTRSTNHNNLLTMAKQYC